ncbi:MAG: D-alanyl-D-alanine carboxypeptidase [Clostridia bacterium]|nr:D-alanyl-D-alanine carboxypeptidase [Clostridia bacterium]
MKKPFLSILICLTVAFSFCLPAKAETLPEITSAGFVLCNAETGEILQSKNPDGRLYPASLTKLMTALLTVELAEDLDTEKVTVSKNAVESLNGTHSSTGNLKADETYTLRQLLYLLMLPSGNDSANVLAEYFCQTNAAFAEKMNQKADELGMKNTHYTNPHGLHDPMHYTTAADMALLTQAFLRQPVLKEIASAAEYTVPATELQGEREIKTTNLMKLSGSGYYYADAYGLKTGNTTEAGRCLVAAAERDGLNLVCILMNCPAKYTKTAVVRCEFLEAASVFDYAFETYSVQKLYDEGTVIDDKSVGNTFYQQVDLVLDEDVYATLPKTADPTKTEYTVDWNFTGTNPSAPIGKGEVLGKVIITLDGQTIAESNVVAAQAVAANPLILFWQRIDTYVYIVLGLATALVLLFLLLVIRAQALRRRRRKRRAARRRGR